MTDNSRCTICGEPMPRGEEMFNFHGYSGPCPKPPLPLKPTALEVLAAEVRLWRREFLGGFQSVEGVNELFRAQGETDTLGIPRIQRDEPNATAKEVATLRSRSDAALVSQLTTLRARCERLERAANEAMELLTYYGGQQTTAGNILAAALSEGK